MRSYVGELLAFSLPASIAGALSNFINRVDRLMVGAFLPAAEVGIYQAASQTSALFDLMPNIFNNVIAVRVSHLYARGELGRLDDLYKLGAKVVVLSISATVSGRMRGSRRCYGAHLRSALPARSVAFANNVLRPDVGRGHWGGGPDFGVFRLPEAGELDFGERAGRRNLAQLDADPKVRNGRWRRFDRAR
jgi:hypothetical protein